MHWYKLYIKSFEKNTQHIAKALALALLVFSIAISPYYLVCSFISASAGTALLYLYKRLFKIESSQKSGIISSLKLLSLHSHMTRASNARSSIHPGSEYSKETNLSLKKYRLTGNPMLSFSSMMKSSDFKLRKLGIILYLSFSDGILLNKLASVNLEKNSIDLHYSDALIPLLSNTEIMTLSGTNLFFPIFAGITLNIIKFSAPSVYSGSAIALVAIFIFYIISANVVTVENSFNNKSGAITKIIQLSAFASLALEATLRISSMMI